MCKNGKSGDKERKTLRISTTKFSNSLTKTGNMSPDFSGNMSPDFYGLMRGDWFHLSPTLPRTPNNIKYIDVIFITK